MKQPLSSLRTDDVVLHFFMDPPNLFVVEDEPFNWFESINVGRYDLRRRHAPIVLIADRASRVLNTNLCCEVVKRKTRDSRGQRGPLSLKYHTKPVSPRMRGRQHDSDIRPSIKELFEKRNTLIGGISIPGEWAAIDGFASGAAGLLYTTDAKVQHLQITVGDDC